MYVFAFAGIQLVPDGTLFIHIALILLMIWILNRTFFRPINRIIESRAKFEGGRNLEAESILTSAAEKRSAFSKAMLAARSEGYQLIARERAAAIASRSEKVNSAKASAAALLAGEKQQLESDTQQARAQIAGEAVQLADKITNTILKA